MTTAYLYDAQGHDEAIELTAESVKALGKHQLLWIDLVRSDLKAQKNVATILGFDGDSLEAIVNPPSPPRLENYVTHFQFSVRARRRVVFVCRSRRRHARH